MLNQGHDLQKILVVSLPAKQQTLFAIEQTKNFLKTLLLVKGLARRLPLKLAF